MNIIIKGHNFEVTDAIRNYADQKLSSLFNNLSLSNIDNVDVELSAITRHHKHGEIYKASATVPLGSRKIHVESTTNDMYKSIDKLKDELAEEIADSSDRKRSLMRRVARKFKKLIKRN